MDYTVNRQTTLGSGELRQLCQKRELNFWKVLECFSLIQHLPRNCLRFFAGSRDDDRPGDNKTWSPALKLCSVCAG